MSDITKKRIRYEILEKVENDLLNLVRNIEEEIEWKSAPKEDGEELPDWRKQEIEEHRAKIAEIREVIKALPKIA